MPSGSHPNTPAYSWDEALSEFLTWYEAHRAAKTGRFYRVQLRQLVRWADENGVPFASFGKRHMDRYLAERARTVSRTTLHHDGVAAKAFFKWCARYDLVDRSPLAEYEVRRAPRPPKYMPTEEDLAALLKALTRYWDPEENPPIKNVHAAKRLFHRTRNYALVAFLVDSACRIGEAVSLRTEDFQASERQVVVRESKGREARVLPLSPPTVEAVRAWMKVRERVMRDADGDEGYLFVSEFGTRIEESKFLKSLKGYLRFAGLSDQITLHSLRRFSINRVAKKSPLAAKEIAGHKDLNTTMLYTKIDADYVRAIHAEADALGSVIGSVLGSKRRPIRKRIV
jgi:site-specific recombinase XerD